MITLKDIAREVGVSHTTVSYVLRGKDDSLRVSPATKEKIIAAGKRLSYACNEHARSVRSGKSRIIGVMGSIYGEMGVLELCGISDTATTHGYTMELFPYQLDESKREEAFESALKTIAGHRVAGVIATAMDERLPRLRKELEKQGVPLVVMDNSLVKCGPHVTSDDFLGGRLAVEHLAGLGHRKIVCMSPDPSSTFARARYEGYESAMRAAGLEPEWVEADTDYPDFNPEFRRAVLRVLGEIRPDAVFCVAESIAVRVMSLATHLGVSIPGDLSVVGYAGLDYSRMTFPPLTTVRQPFYEMGRRSFELLLGHMNKQGGSEKIKLPVTLEIRGSTGEKTGSGLRDKFIPANISVQGGPK